MAYEAVLMIETELPIPFTCADGTGIAKGASLKLSDLMTAASSTGAADNFAGIAGSEKIANDGMVRTDVYRGGIWRVSLSGTCTAGDPALTDAAANHFKTVTLTSALSGSSIAGIFLEDGTDGHTVLMEVRPQDAGGGKQAA